ncbi:hypothetical protein H0H87_008341 [Tephrocybe sp. NHM501043]|nr:hypothetical protein H0H87_008341 [Tephrocybe sp. NHM501043]
MTYNLGSRADCEKQTKGYPGAKYQGFKNAAEAEAFVSGTLLASDSTAPSTSSSSNTITTDSKGKKRTIHEMADESKYDVVYSDGACKGNGKPGSIAGVGVWWGENDPRNIAERCPGEQTNNRAELIAIVRVLESTPKSKKPLLIKTDSQYSMKCFNEWLPKWSRNNFRTAGGEPVKNVGVIKYVSALLKARGLMGQEVRLQYVKGHSGDMGNDGADAQANLGARLPEVTERDWAKAEQEVTKQAEEDRRLNIENPTPVPLQAVAGELARAVDEPRKVRKVDHEVSFSSLHSASSSKSPIKSRHLFTDPTLTPYHVPSPPNTPPPRPIQIIDVSSSSLRDTPPSEARLPSEHAPPHKAALPPSSRSDYTLSTASFTPSSSKPHEEPSRHPKTPIRRHGVGLFTAAPPLNTESAEDLSSLSTVQTSREVPTSILSPSKVTAMSVDAADINLDTEPAYSIPRYAQRPS